MRRSSPFLIFAFTFLAVCLVASSLLAACPDCYIDHKAMKSHGTSANGRPIVRVKLSGQWDVSPGQSDPKMFNAVRDAVRDWNNAVDPSTGRGGFYEFQFDSNTQNMDDRDVNIRITKTPDGYKGPAYVVGPPGGPYQIRIPPDAPQNCISPEALLEVVKHEMGHTAGLAHKEKGFGKCSGNEASMMDAPSTANAPCIQYFRSIQPRDVQVTNDLDNPAYRQGNCKSVGEGRGGANLIEPTPTPEPSPQGGGRCHTVQDFDSFYVGEGCWHEYWTVMTFCDGYLVYFSQADLDVHCY